MCSHPHLGIWPENEGKSPYLRRGQVCCVTWRQLGEACSQVAILGSGNWGCLSAALFPSKMDGWHSLDDISWHSFGSFGSFWRSSQVLLPRSSPAIANVGQTSRSVWKCGSTRKKWRAVSSPRSLTAIMRMWSIFQGWRCLRTCGLTNLIHKLTFTLTHLHWFKAFRVREIWPNKIAPAG